MESTSTSEVKKKCTKYAKCTYWNRIHMSDGRKTTDRRILHVCWLVRVCFCVQDTTFAHSKFDISLRQKPNLVSVATIEQQFLRQRQHGHDQNITQTTHAHVSTHSCDGQPNCVHIWVLLMHWEAKTKWMHFIFRVLDMRGNKCIFHIANSYIFFFL